MPLTADLIDEINLLLQYDLSSAQQGLKVHSSAAPATIAAAGRLHQKGLTDQADGGYLTALGHEAAEHLQLAHRLLAV